MPTYWSPIEKRLRSLDRLREQGKDAKAVDVAVDLVVRHGQQLGPTARRVRCPRAPVRRPARVRFKPGRRTTHREHLTGGTGPEGTGYGGVRAYRPTARARALR